MPLEKIGLDPMQSVGLGADFDPVAGPCLMEPIEIDHRAVDRVVLLGRHVVVRLCDARVNSARIPDSFIARNVPSARRSMPR